MTSGKAEQSVFRRNVVLILGLGLLVCGVTSVLGAPVIDENYINEVAEQVMDKLPPGIRSSLSGNGFMSATIQALLMILVTEIGDKTFFIAAVLAMKNPRGLVLTGALLALYIMTVLSVIMGKAFPLLFSKKYSSVVAAVLFVYFGVVLLRDWYKMRDQADEESEELHEVEEELAKKEPTEGSTQIPSWALVLVSPILLRSFSLTFVAEWGDRSQIATIAFAAAQNAYGVVLGCVIGHTICTALAVLGGRLLASRISEKTVALFGGITFLLFAVMTIVNKEWMD
ncbi:GDT1-like protein 3 [Porphyridium purpureum]|uniref:GDT1 family protein n=1 Tax=Porphyridium purpureum TaxID=35688 RepID=A0A5J4YZX7_PORPP|nr:GDT1-like protein 3 [Porphyridium purpureum]|eukprot:POR7640..scf209_3